MTTDELISYYQNLLIIQYKTRPKAVATIGALAAEAVADQVFAAVRDGFDPAVALGDQLDVLAGYVGAPRRLSGFISTVAFMALPFYADGPTGFGGFASYSDMTVTPVSWKRYTFEPTSYVLTDGELSQLVRYLIAVHASDYGVADIDGILQEFFGINAVLTDNGDMTLTYVHLSSDPSQFFSIVEFLGKLPQPAGVGVSVLTI